MKKKGRLSIYTILVALLFGYLVPVLSLSVYSNYLVGQRIGWKLFSIGIGIAFLGTLFFLWLLSYWRSQSAAPVEQTYAQETPSSPEEEETKKHHLLEHQQLVSHTHELEEQIAQIQAERETWRTEQQEVLQALNAQKQTSEEHLQQQQEHIRELQDTIADQKTDLEKKQHKVALLETKVNDLTYEIKTLLKLAESHVSTLTNAIQHPTTYTPEPAPQLTAIDPPTKPQDFQIQTPEQASHQLRRCLDIAQKITGSHRFGNHFHSMIDSPIDSFTLDLRRLCDALRSENNCGVLLYSPKDNQLIFSNNQVKSLTGWSPEKFTQSFFEILQNHVDWKQNISNLALRREVQLNLTLKTKWGHDIDVHGQVGMIPTGIFRQHAIAVLFI